MVALPVFNARRQLTHTVVAVGMTSLLDAPALQRLVQDMRTEVDALGERP